MVSKIAEGQGRLTTGEFLHFSGQSRGSLLELDTQLELATELGYLQREQYRFFHHAVYEVLGLLNRLMDSLRRKQATS